MSKNIYRIRAANIQDAKSIANVHVKSWQTSYAGIIDEEFLQNISYEKRLQLREQVLQSELFQLVVECDGHIVGFADAGLMREEKQLGMTGEIYALYLLQEHQGQGLGRKLFSQCKQWLKEQHIETFVLWVLKQNTRARNFYVKQGGKVVGEKIIMIGHEEFLEYCYLFENSGSGPMNEK